MMAEGGHEDDTIERDLLDRFAPRRLPTEADERAITKLSANAHHMAVLTIVHVPPCPERTKAIDALEAYALYMTAAVNRLGAIL